MGILFKKIVLIKALMVLMKKIKANRKASGFFPIKIPNNMSKKNPVTLIENCSLATYCPLKSFGIIEEIQGIQAQDVNPLNKEYINILNIIISKSRLLETERAKNGVNAITNIKNARLVQPYIIIFL
jgi:hypothetical protein